MVKCPGLCLHILSHVSCQDHRALQCHRKSLVGIRGFPSSALLFVSPSGPVCLNPPPCSPSAHLGRIMPVVTDREWILEEVGDLSDLVFCPVRESEAS